MQARTLTLPILKSASLRQLEDAHVLDQLHGLVTQTFRCDRSLLNQGRILLGHLIDVANGPRDGTDLVTLGRAGSGNISHDRSNAADGAFNIAHRAAGSTDQLTAAVDIGDRLADEYLDLACGGRTTLGELTHF